MEVTEQKRICLIGQNDPFGGGQGENSKCYIWRLEKKAQQSHTSIKINKIKLKIIFAVSSIINVVEAHCLTVSQSFSSV